MLLLLSAHLPDSQLPKLTSTVIFNSPVSPASAHPISYHVPCSRPSKASLDCLVISILIVILYPEISSFLKWKIFIGCKFHFILSLLGINNISNFVCRYLLKPILIYFANCSQSMLFTLNKIFSYQFKCILEPSHSI